MKQREGILVKPVCRLSEKQVQLIDGLSREILSSEGMICSSAAPAELLEKAGASVEEENSHLRVRIPSSLVDRALESAPSQVVLGARVSENRLVLDAHEPRVRFGSGSETNIWLEATFENGHPEFIREKGSIDLLSKAAHLCEHLDNLDFFIRCVNIQDPEVTAENKDVNKFLTSLNNTTKHVQAGLTSIDALDHVIRMGEIVAGGTDAFRENPVLSFITCAVKSPLQFLGEVTDTFLEISKRRVPVVISSCPMGGTTGPFDEFGMVALINAELLAGVTLNQITAPGAPVLYGAVPVRTRLDNLNDMYGVPEFNHYNADCAQMARHYGLPCYSTAGVADASQPGIQATVEKMITYTGVPSAGAQYIHYAFGLLERTNVFSPEQAVLDDAHIGIVKWMLKEPDITAERASQVISTIREVMASDHQTFIYHLPLPSREPVYVHYPLESEEGGALYAAHLRYQEIMEKPRRPLESELKEEIEAGTPGILPGVLS